MGSGYTDVDELIAVIRRYHSMNSFIVVGLKLQWILLLLYVLNYSKMLYSMILLLVTGTIKTFCPY